jgi:hypothetical protein
MVSPHFLIFGGAALRSIRFAIIAMMLDAKWFERAHWGPGAARRYSNDEYWAQPLEWYRRGRVSSSHALDLLIGSDNALPGLAVAAKPGDSSTPK